MDVIQERETFEKYLRLNQNNPYLATMVIAEEARKIEDKLNYTISITEILSAIMQNRQDMLKEGKTYTYTNHVKRIVYEVCSDVMDISIQRAVQATILGYVKSRHLIYHYEGIEDINKQARVRILVNMTLEVLKKSPF